MPTGKITDIIRRNGYGFISGSGGQKIFFHQRWLDQIRFRELKVGDELIFQVERGSRGMRARRINFLERMDAKQVSEYQTQPFYKAQPGEEIDEDMESGTPITDQPFYSSTPENERTTNHDTGRWSQKIKALFRE
jgi:CspA family cold shock protein